VKKNGFGSLMEWGKVLEEMDRLNTVGLLDDWQEELTRVLRYKDNWRLTERVLEYAKGVREPTEGFLKEICAIMCDTDVWLDNRILAADALGALVPKSTAGPGSNRIVEAMRDIINSPQPPILQNVVAKALASMG